MSRLLVVEYLHAHPQLYHTAEPGMRREGAAMLRAVLHDALNITGWQVATLLCEQAQDSLSLDVPSLQITVTSSAADFDLRLQQAAEAADHVLLVAPETDHLLARTAQQLRQLPCELWLPTQPQLEICCDKLTTWQRFASDQIPMLPCDRFSHATVKDRPDCVVKHRLGAGGDGVWLARHLNQHQTEDLFTQPWVSATSLSMGVIGQGHSWQLLPLAEQLISWHDGRPVYQGGSLPADVTTDVHREAVTVADRVLEQLTPFRGYMGLDFLLTEQGALLLNEINPRLTTSYVGYRRLLAANLLAVMAGCQQLQLPDPASDSQLAVSFRSDGHILMPDDIPAPS